ncbi:MAG: transcriptional repressor [Deltaproteobacteria bacterium]|nr:transcriptional repressor [Deltaproteobacteria bacterium]
MCQLCNYPKMLDRSGLDPTPNRLRVMEVIGNNPSPTGAQDIFTTLNRTADINRVTVYRILDLLVEKGLVERLNGGGRSLVYGLSPNENHPPHPHFHCRRCGAIQCLQPDSISMDIHTMQRSFAGEISSVEIRINGICRNCLKTGREQPSGKKPDK